MAIDTYSGLLATAASWAQRDDVTAILPDCVAMATARLSDELRTPEMETVASTSITAEWTGLPSNFRAMRLMELGGEVLEYATPWQLQKLVQYANYVSTPVYTIQDMQFRVYPLTTTGTVELTYYAALPALVASSDTNWLLLKRPDVYLQATLQHAWEFILDDARQMKAAQFVDKYIAEANRAANRIKIGAAPLAVKAA